MIKKIIFLCFLALVLAAGSISAMPVSNEETELRRLAEPIIGSVIKAYNEKNYDRMAVNFSESMYRYFSRMKFEEIRRERFPLFGKINSTTYLGFVTRLGETVIVYKCEARKSQFLIKLVLSKEEGKLSIVGLWFE